MKRSIFLTSLLGLTMVMPLTTVACGKEDLSPIETDVSIEPYWTLNYVASSRKSAPFKLDFANPDNGQIAQIKITNQVLDGEINDCLKFTKSGKDTLTINLNQSTVEEMVYVETIVPLFDNVHEIGFSFEITIKKNGYSDKKITIDNLWLEVAKPTIDQDMFTYEDEDKKILTGINQDPEKLEAFNQCNMLIIPDTVEKIGDFAFAKKTGTVSLLPSNMKWLLLDQTWGTGQGTLKEIGVGAFRGAPCTGILRFPNSLTTIGETAFWSASFSGSLIFPNSVTTIGNQAFNNCKNFNKIEKLPKSSEGLGNQIFQSCTGLKSDIIIPDGWTSVPPGFLSGCNGLDGNLVIGKNVKQLNSACFNGCSNLQGTLIIPDGLTSIGDHAFENCSGFTGNLVIPNSVTSIGTAAFSYCKGFGSLKIPYSIETIANNSFSNCTNISEIDLTEWTTIPEASYKWLFQGYSQSGIVWINENQDLEVWEQYLQTCSLPEGWTCQHKE